MKKMYAMPHVDSYSSKTNLKHLLLWLFTTHTQKPPPSCNSPAERKPAPQYWWATQGKNRWTWWDIDSSSEAGSPELPCSSWDLSYRPERALCSWPAAASQRGEATEQRHRESGSGERGGEPVERRWWKREISQQAGEKSGQTEDSGQQTDWLNATVLELCEQMERNKERLRDILLIHLYINIYVSKTFRGIYFIQNI